MSAAKDGSTANVRSRDNSPSRQHAHSVDDAVVWRTIDSLAVNPRNSRRHPREQIHRLARTIRTLGVFVPILIDDQGTIMAGHGRLAAARQLEMAEVPTLTVSGLTDAQKRAFVIADNRMAEMAKWDRQALKLEFKDLVVLDLDVELTGFDTGQIDVILDDSAGSASDEMALMPLVDGQATSRVGDLWELNRHRLLCADATSASNYAVLLADRKADLVFTDPPYNVPIARNVSGLGKVRHREFAMASGEMSARQFTRFLKTIFGHLADHTAQGSIHFVCMDWRHLYEVLEAGHDVYSSLKNLCVWNKDNGGMGSLYRSKHELVLVFQNGAGRFINNVNLGATGRYRTNVWDYPGMSSMHQGREDTLAMHPTVKPVALVADAIRDCSKRNQLVLDPFAGSGTTIMAAERTGRLAASMEIDPAYVDVAIDRWQKATGLVARLSRSGQAFQDVKAERGVAGKE